MDTVLIKTPETDDEIRGRAYVHWKAWQEAYTGLIDPAYLEKRTLERSLERAYEWTDRVLIAKDGGRVVGFTSFGPAREEGPAFGEIYAMYVLADHYGTGVGAALMEAALRELAAYPRVCLWALKGNARAIRFYEKHGFHADGAEKRLDALAADVIRMTRNESHKEDFR